MDRQRPLWEMYLVEGLEGGLQAMVVKVHHAAIDGVSGAELTAAWLDLEADRRRPSSTTGTTGGPSVCRARSISWSVHGLNSPPVLPKRQGRPDVARRPRCVSQRTTASSEAPSPPSPLQRAEDVVQPGDHPPPARRFRRSGARGPESRQEPFRMHRQRRRAGALRWRIETLSCLPEASFPKSRSSLWSRCRCEPTRRG